MFISIWRKSHAMHPLRGLIGTLSVLLSLSCDSALSHENSLKRPLEGKSQTFVVWEDLSESLMAPESPELEAGAPAQNLMQYRERLRKLYGSFSSDFLIERQSQVYENVLAPGRYKVRLLSHFQLFRRNRVGELRELSRLESRLFEKHLELNRNLAPRTEFQALVLKRGERLKVYVGFATQSDGVAPSLKGFSRAIRQDLQTGWKAKGLIHNHPFLYQPKDLIEDPRSDWGGALVLSAPDVYGFHQAVREWNLESYMVTNGFETLELDVVDLRKFPSSLKSWPPEF